MNSRRICAFILMFLSIATNYGFAQQYAVTSYTIENGLPTRMVQDACQDKDGFMWFATYSGITSYDGFSFKTYNRESGLPEQRYRRLKYDEKGVLWAVPVRMCDTIVYRKDNAWHRFGPVDPKTKRQIHSFDVLYRDGMPVLAISGGRGIEINLAGKWTHLDFTPGTDTIRNLNINSAGGKFYAATEEGIFMVERLQDEWKSALYFKSDDGPVTAMKFEQPGGPGEKVWMLMSDKIICRRNGSIIFEAGGFKLPEPFLVNSASLGIDNTGNIYFGNNWAKYYIRSSDRRVYSLMVANGFSSNGASSVFIDREQNIWFTDTRGIDKLTDLHLQNYREFNGLLENEVTAITELREGGFVLGHNTGLTLFDHRGFKRIPFPGAMNSLSRVLDIQQDRNGVIWFAASTNGLGRLSPDGKVTWIKTDTLSMVSTVFEDHTGTIRVGTIHSMFYLKNGRLIEYKHQEGQDNPIRKLFSTRNGELIGTSNIGLFRISGGDVKKIPFGYETEDESTYAYWQTTSGKEYVGTSKGLCTIENDTLRKLSQDSIRIESPVYFILQDQQDNFWMGSNNGVFKWDGGRKLEVIGVQNGLAGRETNRSAGIMDSKGGIWIGTEQGLNHFLPGYAGPGKIKPAVKLLTIEDGLGGHHSYKGNPRIESHRNTLYFHFRALSFVKEQLLNYRYKLEGVDRDWQSVNQPDIEKIKYTGVPPGQYHFFVQARNGFGEWSDMAKSGTITISSPLYLTWWFILAVFLFICLFIYGIIQIILQQKYNRKLENEIAERKSSEAELHRSREMYKLITEKMTDVVWLMDQNGTSLFVSKSIEQFTGYTIEEYLAQSIDDRFTPASAAIGKKMLSMEISRLEAHPELLSSYVVSQIMEYRCKDGRTKWGELLMTPYFGANKEWLGIHGVTRDITERRQSEVALHEKASELERFNNLMIGRELKMIELKKEVNELIEKSGGRIKYIIHE